jgi:hypothetical protein
MLEHVCNENEKDLQHFVITEQDKKEIHLEPTLLSKYAGIYERPGRDPITVTVAGDQLIIDRPGRGKTLLFAQSETVFHMAETLIEFVSDDHGAVSHLIARFVDGDLKFVRRSGATPAPAAAK